MISDGCDCPGCRFDGSCYWPQGMTGAAPWSPDTLDGVELPPRVVGLIEELADRITPERVNSDPDS